ncbi:hypothetical protein QR680_004246 [Steinernema hermaphroditum]|uniref:Uncharacterized protein n=1 Tax=Steinernema hermaphroditum TaxID=289476 RepID=A0AA39LSW2_9BILA|nr:hypothetical protein QR680_004246 [Steinernema hermaphroditum]
MRRVAPTQRSIRAKFVKLKEKRKRWLPTLLMGLVLNIIGSVMGYLRAEIDENIVESIVDSRLREYGIVNGTRNITGAFGVEIDLGEEPYQPSAIVLVMLTTFGRMFNVIGTIKMYRAMTMFLSERKRQRIRATTERFGAAGTEGDGEWNDAFVECCQLCAAF